MKDLFEIYNLPLDELLKEAKKYCTKNVEFCSLISAKTGKCGENCRYCAQSSHYFTHVHTHPLVNTEDVLKCAKAAKEHKVSRFAIVTSGRKPQNNNFYKMLDMIRAINSVEGLTSCASIGIVDEEQAKMLKDAGLKRFHHNINTSKSYHPNVCTTHTFEDRLKTIELVRKYGMEVCCGVIIGMGETPRQRVEMAQHLIEINPESVPVNFLTPIKGTPFESYGDKIDEEHILRTLAMFKIALPKSVIRFAGGRALRLSEKNREIALENCVEGILVGNYLTTTGIDPEKDIETVKKIGKEILENPLQERKPHKEKGCQCLNI